MEYTKHGFIRHIHNMVQELDHEGDMYDLAYEITLQETVQGVADKLKEYGQDDLLGIATVMYFDLNG